MHTKTLLLAALMACAFSPALADDSAPRTVGHAGHPVTLHFDALGVAGPHMHMRGKTVKNAPFSAEAVSEQQHSLADGNQIVNKSSSMFYRDSAGRTRQELRDGQGEVRTITIFDPVAGSTYFLRPKDKTATKLVAPQEMAKAAREHAEARVKHLHKEGRLHGAEGDKMIVKRVERVDGELRKQIHEDVRIHMLGRMGEGMHGTSMGPVIAGAIGDMKWAAKATTRELGQKDIDGVKAEGKVRSYEIPAGEVGNRNPIVVADETWYSPELQVTLLARHSDPRTGERVYRLHGLKREEPAAALFSVPSDYTVTEGRARVKRLEKQEAK